MSTEETLYGALEGGGTKMVLAVVTKEGKIINQTTIPTTTQKETTEKMVQYFKQYKIKALGIGTFGPVDVNQSSPTYGSILNTPKEGWKGYSYIDSFKELGVPIKIDTDVNASCIGEITYGSAKGLNNVIYITVGTGIGVGICVEGKMVHGILHPEAGHILLTKNEKDKGNSVCPFHKNCLEGLASGPSILKRYGKPADELKDDNEVWEIESDYIAQAIVSIIYTTCPQKIILGGGVMNQKHIFPLIRKKVVEFIGGYLDTKELRDIDNYIVYSVLDGNQGILGSAKLGMDCVSE